MGKRRFALVALLCIIALMFTGCGGQNTTEPVNEQSTNGNGGEQQSYNWKFALDEAQGSLQDVYAQIFKEIVEEKSEGRIKLDIYYLGQLGDGSNQGELIQNGGIDLGFMAAGAAGPMVPESNIFSMHYIFPNNLENAKKFLRESKVINEDIAAAYADKNMYVLDWLDEGFMQWSGNRPIRQPSDFNGFKMRVMAAPIITATYEAYGANPVTIPFSELYSALQLNMADGQTNPVEIIEQMKYYEVQDYLMLSNSDLYVASLIMYKPLWESLPEDIKIILAEAVQETRPLYDKEYERIGSGAIDILINEGMEIIELEDEAIAEFRELAKQAESKLIEVAGPNAQKLFEEFIEEASAYY